MSEASTVTTLEAAGDWFSESDFRGASDENCMEESSSNSYSGEFSMSFSSVEGTIDGIEVVINYRVGDSNDYVQVDLLDSTSTWVSLDAATPGSGQACSQATDQTVGGSGNLWGGTWTAAWIKSSSFRIRVRAKASGKSGADWVADNATITVYYTEAGAEDLMVID